MQKPRISDACFPVFTVSSKSSTTTCLALLGLMWCGALSAQDNATAGVITTQPKSTEVIAEPGAKLPAGQGTPVKAATPDASKDANKDFQVTMEQSIEAARKRRMRELAEIVRQQMGLKDSKEDMAVPVASGLALPVLPAVTPAMPRLWSLSAAGSRVWAELWLNGQIIQLDSMNGQIIQLDADQSVPDLGAWTALTLTENGLLLERKDKVAASKKSKQPVMRERLLLRAPTRGISAVSYKFPLPSVAGPTMPDSAQRASQLP